MPDNSTHRSAYAAKVDGGRQMYGGRGSDSCCAHRVTTAQILAARKASTNRRMPGYLPPEMVWSESNGQV